MVFMRYKLLILAIPVLLSGCGQRESRNMTPVAFPLVNPPAMMEDAQDRADYLALHYWDAFADTSRVYSRDTSLVGGVRKVEFEQKFADWASCLSMVRFDVGCKAVETLYAKMALCEGKDTSSNIFESVNDLVYKYLYDPNSPLRYEDLYGIYARKLSSSEFVSPLKQAEYKDDARLCALNRTGTKAADFRFSDKNGKIHTLYSIKAEWILLFFSNPGCKACSDIIDYLKSSEVIQYMIRSGELAVLNIYIDEDLEAWKSYMPIYPENWYNGFDPDYIIRTDMLYHVRAIPSLYVLDKDKKVVMKDATEENVFAFFGNFGI